MSTRARLRPLRGPASAGRPLNCSRGRVRTHGASACARSPVVARRRGAPVVSREPAVAEEREFLARSPTEKARVEHGRGLEQRPIERRASSVPLAGVRIVWQRHCESTCWICCDRCGINQCRLLRAPSEVRPASKAQPSPPKRPDSPASRRRPPSAASRRRRPAREPCRPVER